MKRCIFCGHYNEDENRFCVKCGKPFILPNNVSENIDEQIKDETVTEVVKDISDNENKNTLATVSFILGIVSMGAIFMIIGIPYSIVISLFALTTGIISLIRKPNKSKPKAIMGIVFSGVALLLSIMLLSFGDAIVEVIKNVLVGFCKYPKSDECKMIKDIFPNLFK